MDNPYGMSYSVNISRFCVSDEAIISILSLSFSLFSLSLSLSLLTSLFHLFFFLLFLFPSPSANNVSLTSYMIDITNRKASGQLFTYDLSRLPFSLLTLVSEFGYLSRLNLPPERHRMLKRAVNQKMNL